MAIGAGIGGLVGIEETTIKHHEGGPRKDLAAVFNVPSTIINSIAGQVSIMTGAKGPNILAVTACTTATHNIGLAMRMIQYGEADVMIAGGAEFGHHADFTRRLLRDEGVVHAQRRSDQRLASPGRGPRRLSWPPGDGAGILVIEEYERAGARGARIYAELIGFGMSGDAYHMTAPSENGEGAARALHAQRDQGCRPQSVGHRLHQRARHLHAGGRSRRDDGHQERARRGDAAKVMVSPTKSMTGHLLGAAGGVEAVFSTMALHTGVIPPTINLENPAGRL